MRMRAMDSTGAGWERFAQADWEGARAAFADALEERPGEPEALDGLGQALWWLGERDAAIERRRQAYAAYRRRDDGRNAGRLATYLASEHRIDGQHAAAAGWLARARRLLAGVPPGPETGWLAIEETKRASDPAEAEARARAALDLAQALGDPDIECMALAQLGRAVVRQGRVEEGLGMLDEAMTVALGGESSDPLACGDACCTTLVVCDGLADLGRAAEWCEAVVDFTERRRYLLVQSWCRSIFAGVLVRAGDWERAEAVLGQALQGQADRRRGAGQALPLTVLAELRLRQGRNQEAARLLEGLEDEPVALEEARARLVLARVQAHAGSPLALAAARAARDAFERLGARRDADEAAALLRALGAAGRTAARGERDELTAREREVLSLIVAGLSNAQIAERLVIAPKTAEHHVGRVLGKLGVRSRAEAAAPPVRGGL